MLKLALDFIGSSLSLSATILFVRASRWAWIISLVAIAINATLFYRLGIYGDFALQILYAFLSLYGLWHWQPQGQESAKVKIFSGKQWLVTLALLLPATLLMREALLWLRSDVANLDAITTTLSVLAQYLMARKYIETWVVWFIVDVLYIGLYASKGIPFHSITLFIYCFLAVAGFLKWHRLAGFSWPKWRHLRTA